MPPIPKPPGMRQRRNKATSAATLTSTATTLPENLPDVPGRKWHALTKAWWSDAVTGIRVSPMASEYANNDVHGLVALGILWDDFWKSDDVEERKQLMGEIRLQGQRYGTSPIDRRRLQWEIARVDDVAKKKTPPAKVNAKAANSRDVLRMVK